MSNLSVANIVNPTTADTTPTENLSKQVCKVWADFSSTGTTVINDSHGVASITDLGVGRHQINFTQPFADTNYSVSGQASLDGQVGISGTVKTLMVEQLSTKLATSVVLATTTGGASDAVNISFQIFSS